MVPCSYITGQNTIQSVTAAKGTDLNVPPVNPVRLAFRATEFKRYSLPVYDIGIHPRANQGVHLDPGVLLL